MEKDEILTCGCCGRGVQNNEAENVHFGMIPYPDDNGFGMCRDCGGDPTAKGTKKKLGWAKTCFCEARFPVIRDALSDKGKANWDKATYAKKCFTVFTFVEKGILSW